jgi:general secretion pathway protein C
MQESTIKRFAWWIGIFILAALSWQAGKFTWLSWGEEDKLVISGGKPEKTSVNRLKTSDQVQHLFGQPRRVARQAIEAQQNAPRTMLNLQLMGVVVSQVAEDSGAIIAEKGRSADYYKVNDPLPGNSKLVDVYSDHVLLSRKGVVEKLSFDDSTANQESIFISESDDSVGIKPADINTPEQFLDVARARLSQDATGALASVGLSSAAGRRGPSGYIYDGNNPMLAAMNMQKGDIIRSVNGHVLGDMEEDQAKLQELYESGSLEVEIEREGATFTITYPIP